MTKEKEADDKVLTELGREQARITGKWLREMDVKPDEFVQSVSRLFNLLYTPYLGFTCYILGKFGNVDIYACMTLGNFRQ